MPDRYDENLFLGYVESDLSPQDRARFEQMLADDPHLRQLAGLVAQDRQALRNLPEQEAPPELIERVTAQLERGMLLDAPAPQVAQPRQVAEPRRVATFRIRQFIAYAAMAAMVMLSASVLFYSLVDPRFSTTAPGSTAPGTLSSARRSADDARPAPPGPVAFSNGDGIERPSGAKAGGNDLGTNDQTRVGELVSKQANSLAGKRVSTQRGGTGQTLAQADGRDPLASKPGVDFAQARQFAQKGAAAPSTSAGAGAPPLAPGAASNAVTTQIQARVQPQLTPQEQANVAEQWLEDRDRQAGLGDDDASQVQIGARNQFALLMPADEPAFDRAVTAEAAAAVGDEVTQFSKARAQEPAPPLPNVSLDKVRRAKASAAVAEPEQRQSLGRAQMTAADVVGPSIQVTSDDPVASQRDLLAWAADNRLACVAVEPTDRQVQDLEKKRQTAESPYQQLAQSVLQRRFVLQQSQARSNEQVERLARLDVLKSETLTRGAQPRSRATAQTQAPAPAAPPPPPLASQQIALVVIPNSQVPQLLEHLNARAGQSAQLLSPSPAEPQRRLAELKRNSLDKVAADAPLPSKPAAAPAPVNDPQSAPADDTRLRQDVKLADADDAYFAKRLADPSNLIVRFEQTHWGILLDQQLPLNRSVPLQKDEEPLTIPVVIEASASQRK